MSKYMINVDLLHMNDADHDDGCSFISHRGHGPHYDLTVHFVECSARGKREPPPSPEQYWLPETKGTGYTRAEVIQKLDDLQFVHKKAHARTCGRCSPDREILTELGRLD